MSTHWNRETVLCCIDSGPCSAVVVTCEKDEGMGLCTFNFVLRLSLHLVCLLFGTSSLHLLNFF